MSKSDVVSVQSPYHKFGDPSKHWIGPKRGVCAGMKATEDDVGVPGSVPAGIVGLGKGFLQEVIFGFLYEYLL